MNDLIIQERIEQKIYLIRSKKVMLDSDLAKLYGVTTEALNQAVKRNPDNFPSDFMYLLTKQEVAILRSQNVISRLQSTQNIELKEKWGGRRAPTKAFTDNGIAMLSSVLKSTRAIQVNIQIMRTFTRLRELIASNELIRQKIEELEKKCDQQFQVVFEAIRKIIELEPERPKRQIGFNAQKSASEKIQWEVMK